MGFLHKVMRGISGKVEIYKAEISIDKLCNRVYFCAALLLVPLPRPMVFFKNAFRVFVIFTK